jgi:magnesium-transporting ATPase (P-type)
MSSKIKSITHLLSCLLSSTSSSSTSSTYTSYWWHYRNSYQRSRLVCCASLSRPVGYKSSFSGFIVTYIAPLAFVLFVTMGKEAFDDIQRNQRDREANSQKYLILEAPTDFDDGPYTRFVPSSSLRVGDLVHLEKNQRVPADLILLRTSDQSGTCFIRTDQLDGETDWKLRVAVPACQKLNSDRDLLALDAEIYGMYDQPQALLLIANQRS